MMKKDMHSTNCMRFWSNLLRSSCLSKRGKSRKKEEEEGLRGKLNVNEEYKEVFRTKSYVDIWSKVQLQLKGSSSSSVSMTPNHKRSSCLSSSSSLSSSPFASSSNHPSISSPLPFKMHLSECLLEPRQEFVLETIQNSKIQALLKDFFEVTLDANNLCESLLGGIHKTRSNTRYIRNVIRISRDGEIKDECLSNYTSDQIHEMMIQELIYFARLSNPLSIITNGAVDFHEIHEKQTLLLRKLTSRRRRIKRWRKFLSFYKKAASYGFLVTYAALAIVLLILALHSVVGLLGVPALLLPFSTGVIKRASGECLKTSVLDHLCAQLDITAKGVYILTNDFDTVGRLVTRLHEEVEHKRAVAEMCVQNRKNHEVVKKAVKELHIHENGFVEQLEELEEHIYLCFLTINRSRRLVIQEFLAT